MPAEREPALEAPLVVAEVDRRDAELLEAELAAELFDVGGEAVRVVLALSWSRRRGVCECGQYNRGDDALAERLPSAVFSAAQVRELERLAIETCGVTDYELMCRAGGRGVARRSSRAGRTRARWSSCCGAGNNAGDGLVLARLAQAAGRAVRVLRSRRPSGSRGAAAQAADDCRAAGVAIERFERAGARRRADVIVDALLGTALDAAARAATSQPRSTQSTQPARRCWRSTCRAVSTRIRVGRTRWPCARR